VSKAFTRESDDDSRAEEIPSVRPQLPPGTRKYITKEGAARLKQRLSDLLEMKQALAARRNEAGPASKADLRKIESAIRKVQQTLDAVVVAEIPGGRERVAFGATVMVRNGNGEEAAYHIVGVEEADPERGAISWISPLAPALLSRRAGEKVLFRSPSGDEELMILTVGYSGGSPR
jgi:transcription elongation factor GreB